MTWRAPALMVLYMLVMIPVAPQLEKLQIVGYLIACMASALVMAISAWIDRRYRIPDADEVVGRMVKHRMQLQRQIMLPETFEEATLAVARQIEGCVLVLDPQPHYCTLIPGPDGCRVCTPMGSHRAGRLR